MITANKPRSDGATPRPRRPAIGLILCVYFHSSPTIAHLPELFGREYLRVDPRTYQPPKNPDRERILSPPLAAESEFESDIENLEMSAGAYASGLTDPLINLYRAQLDRGDVEDAVTSLRRAIQLVRINEGLYTESQLPLLRQLIRLHQGQANYAELGDAYSHYYRILLVNSQKPTDEKLANSLEYLNWERQLYASRSDGVQRSHLLKAYQANDDLLKTLGATDRGAYIALAESQLRNLYLILGDHPINAAVTATNSQNAHVERRLSKLQRFAFGQGLQLLQGMIERTESSPPIHLAEAYLQRGDWLYWNGRLSRAERDYQTVYELMAGDENSLQLALWFDEPVELPDEKRLWPLIDEKNQRSPMVIEASFLVNSQGEPREIEVRIVGENEEGHKGQAQKIRAMLRDTHFRPRIGQEGPETGPRVTRYYRLVSIR